MPVHFKGDTFHLYLDLITDNTSTVYSNNCNWYCRVKGKLIIHASHTRSAIGWSSYHLDYVSAKRRGKKKWPMLSTSYLNLFSA